MFSIFKKGGNRYNERKFMRFMQGRYGVLDTLGKVLLVLGLVLAFFAPVFSGRPCDRNGILPAWLGDVSFMHISGCFPEM